jgi:hypothetical protein
MNGMPVPRERLELPEELEGLAMDCHSVSFDEHVGDLRLIVKHIGKLSYVLVSVGCIRVYTALLCHQLCFLLLGFL